MGVIDMVRMKTVVIIPAKDEQATIGDILQRMPKSFSVIVVDDGSIDKTAEIASSFGAKVISHKKNRGVGVAFQTGIQAALREGADIIVNMDADGQMYPEHITFLIEPIEKGIADVVIVNRFYKGFMDKMPLIKRIGNRMFSYVLSKITGEDLKDTQCGFRAYSREAIKKMHVFGKFTYTQESIMDLSEKGLKIIELPIPILAERLVGKSRVVRNVISYGIKVSLIILRAMRDYEPLKFFGIPGLILSFVGGGMDVYVVTQKLFFDISIMEYHPWVLFFGSLILVMGIFCLVFAMLADMYVRHRKMLEEVLYRLR